MTASLDIRLNAITRWRLRLLMVLFVAAMMEQVHGFANNLIVTTVGCMTELDTSEVIMNNMVKAVDESDFPEMHLVVVDDGDNHLESPYHYNPADAEEIVVAFVNPYTKEQFDDDLQFVMELLDEADAEFISGGTIGCDGNRRVAARIQDYDGKASLQIHDTTKRIEILAGWATGHNSVRLTPKLVLEPKPKEKAPEVKIEEQTPDKETAEELLDAGNNDNNNKKEEEAVQEKVHEVKNGKLLEIPDDLPKQKSSSVKGETKKGDSIDIEANEDRLLGHMKQKERQKKTIDGTSAKKENRANREKQPNLDRAPPKKVDHVNREAEEKNEPLTIKVRNKKDFIETADKLKKARAMAGDAPNMANNARAMAGDAASRERTDDRAIASSSDEEELEPIKHRTSILNHQKGISEETRRKQLEEQMRNNFPEHVDYADRLDTSSHLIACAFFILSMGSIFVLLGKKREKGRRDL